MSLQERGGRHIRRGMSCREMLLLHKVCASHDVELYLMMINNAVDRIHNFKFNY